MYVAVKEMKQNINLLSFSFIFTLKEGIIG
jgi:hypothetical protein